MEEVKTTEEKILESAVEIFAQKGFNGTTTKEIAQQAGVAEGTIFRYFPKKKDILHGILLKMIEVVGPKIIGGGLKDIFQGQGQKSDKEIIMAFMKNRVGLLNSHSQLVKVMFNEAQYHPDLQVAYFEKVVPPVKEMIDQFFQIGIEEGRFRNHHPSAMTLTLLGCMVSSFLGYKVESLTKNLSLDELLEQTVDIFLHGISK